MRKKIYIFSLLLFTLNIQIANSQTASRKSIQAVAEKSMASKNYYDALMKYKELIEFDKNNISYLYNAAEAARFHGAFSLSRDYYEAVVKHEGNNQYPLASFNLAKVKQMMGDYKGAKLSYTTYLTEFGNANDYFYAYSEKEIRACDWAINQINNPNKEVKFKRLGDNINSEYSDFGASGREDILYFSSNRFDNIHYKLKPKRTMSKLLTAKANESARMIESSTLDFKGKSIANATYSGDMSSAVFSVCEDQNDYDKICKLYKANIDKNGSWTDVTELPDHINLSGFTTTMPNISKDLKTGNELLFFTSNRSGGKGMLDIWLTVIDKNGAYSEPVNINEINSAEDDVTPFFDEKNSLLYFSSKGFIGLGGFDIYSTRKSGNSYSTPVNLGSPLNSSFDELYFNQCPCGKSYFSSNRTESKLIDDINNACCLDIYAADIPICDVKLRTLVFDELTNDDLKGVTIKLVELGNSTNAPIIITQDNSNEFIIPLDCNKEYKVEASKPGYTTESTTILSGRPGEFQIINKKLYLKQENVKLDVLTFDKQTNTDLIGCKVILIDLDDPAIPPVIFENLDTNLNKFVNIKKCHKYRITVSKNEYATHTKEIIVDCNASGKIVEKIYLDKFLFSLLPLTLYFDNDRPLPSGKATNSNLTYTQTYNTFVPRKKVFINRYCKIKQKERVGECKSEIEAFFSNEVIANHAKLDTFMDALLEDLAKGKKYEIFIKGYASPLASNDYNFNLGQRRIQTVRNEFARWNSKGLNKYLRSGMLKITERSFGEETAPASVPYDAKDPASIYTIEASRERRVELVEILNK